MSADAVRDACPELALIEDEALRSGVLDAWTTAMAAGGVTDLEAVPWLPPTQRDLGIDDATLVGHVRDVTQIAVDAAETLRERRDAAIDLDTLVAGALVHDVSKLVEFDGMASTPVADLLGHPYYGVHLVAQADLPVELAHVVLSHTSRTSVEPATLEAVLVRRADEVASAAIRDRALADHRES
jgi:hypothetical protein